MTTSLASSSPSITLRSIRSSDLLRLSTSNSFFCNANWRLESIQNYSWKSDVSLEAKHDSYRISMSHTGRRKTPVFRGSMANQSSKINFRPMREHIFTRKMLYCLKNDTQGCLLVSTGMSTYMYIHTLSLQCTYIQKRARIIKWTTYGSFLPSDLVYRLMFDLLEGENHVMPNLQISPQKRCSCLPA